MRPPRIFSITRHGNYRRIFIVDFSRNFPARWPLRVSAVIHANYSYIHIYIYIAGPCASFEFLYAAQREFLSRKRLTRADVLVAVYIYLFFVDLFYLVSSCFPFPFSGSSPIKPSICRYPFGRLFVSHRV